MVHSVVIGFFNELLWITVSKLALKRFSTRIKSIIALVKLGEKFEHLEYIMVS